MDSNLLEERLLQLRRRAFFESLARTDGVVRANKTIKKARETRTTRVSHKVRKVTRRKGYVFKLYISSDGVWEMRQVRILPAGSPRSNPVNCYPSRVIKGILYARRKASIAAQDKRLLVERDHDRAQQAIRSRRRRRAARQSKTRIISYK